MGSDGERSTAERERQGRERKPAHKWLRVCEQPCGHVAVWPRAITVGRACAGGQPLPTPPAARSRSSGAHAHLPTLHRKLSAFPHQAACRGRLPLTYAARRADADDGDAAAARVVQELEEFMQHNGDGRDAHPMLAQERRSVTALGPHVCSVGTPTCGPRGCTSTQRLRN